MYEYMKTGFRKTLTASLALLLVVGCLLSACSGGNTSPSQSISGGYPPLDLPDWYGYSWVRDTEFNSLDTQEQLSRVTTACLTEDSQTYLRAIKVAPNGDVYIVGLEVHSESDTTTALIARCDSNLNLIKAIESSDFAYCFTLDIDTEGNIYISCIVDDGKVFIVKFNSDLDEICRQEVGLNTNLQSIGIANDGSLYACGYLRTSESNIHESDAIIAKYSAELELLGYQTWNGGHESNLFNELAVAVDGSVVVVGETHDLNPPTYPVLRKYGADLSFEAEVVVEPDGTHDRFVDLAIAPGSSVYTVFSSGYNNGDDEVWRVIKYTSALEEDGFIFLAEEVTSAANLPSRYTSFLNLEGIEVDRDGLVYCVGHQSALAVTGDTSDSLVAVVLSDELSILNVAHLPVLPVNKGFDPLVICLSDDANLYIANCYVDLSTEPTFAQIVK
jgi:hypothetical protein